MDFSNLKSSKIMFRNAIQGNAHFHVFDSLAVCSKCLDISQNISHVNVPSNISALSGSQNVTYSLPGGAEVEFSALFEDQQLLMGPEIVVTSEFPSAVTKQVLDLQDPLLSLAILQFPDVKERCKMEITSIHCQLPTNAPFISASTHTR
jgi:hypothetical protein